jgi:hypothetical protein
MSENSKTEEEEEEIKFVRRYYENLNSSFKVIIGKRVITMSENSKTEEEEEIAS